MSFKKVFLIFLICFGAVKYGTAQVKGLLKEGYRNYGQKNFRSAEKNYSDALDKEPDSYDANFNMGDALFRQGKYKEAAGYFNRASGLARNNAEKESSLYNLGNSYLKQEEIEESITAYKNALKLDPDKIYTKYNLSYAIALRKKKQNSRPQNQPKQDKKDENAGPEKNQPEQKQPDPGKNGEQKQPKYDNQKQTPDKSGMSDAEAGQILGALKNEEQKIRDRIFDNRKRQNYRRSDKPW